MQDLSDPVKKYLNEVLIRELSPAFLLADKSGHMLESGGNLELYGISQIKHGSLLENELYFLVGLFPFEDGDFLMPMIDMQNGKVADIHFFKDLQGIWILFLDASQEAARQELLQQKGNELALLKVKYQKISGEGVGKAPVNDSDK